MRYAGNVKAKVGEEIQVVPLRDVTKAPAIHQTASGNPITLTDAGEGTPVVDFGMDGKTEQVQTTGVQLFDASRLQSTSAGGATVTNNGDGSFTVSGTGMLNETFSRIFRYSEKDTKSLLREGTIKLKSVNSIPYLFFRLDEGNNTLFELRTGREQAEITEEILSKNNLSIVMGFYGVNGTEIKNAELKPMVYQSGDGTWEPYTGGHPSPSPEYPQEIVNAGKYNEDTQKWEYEVSVEGLNLLDYNKWNGASITKGTAIYKDYGIILTATEHDCCTSWSDDKSRIEVKPDTEYTLSWDHAGDIGDVYVFYNGTTVNMKNTSAANKKLSFKTLEDTTFIRFRVGVTNVGGTGIYKNIMLNKGSELLPFEPYRTPQTVLLQSDRPLTKWDRLYKRDGQWGWVFNSNNIVFDGSEDENWMKHSNNRFYIAISDKIGSGLNGEKNYLCNKLIPFNTNIEVINMPNNTIKESGISGQKNMYLRIDEAGNDVESFKTWLQSNSLLIWYKTAEETFVPLTTPEQSALEALTTYFPTTIIAVEAGELAPEIEVEYVADTKTYIDNKFAELTQNLAATQNTLLEV